MTIRSNRNATGSSSASYWSAPLERREVDRILRCQRQIAEFLHSHVTIQATPTGRWNMTLEQRDVEQLQPMLARLDRCTKRAALPEVALSYRRRVYRPASKNAEYPKGYCEVLDGRRAIGVAPVLLPEWVEHIEASGHRWPFLKAAENGGEMVGCIGTWKAARNCTAAQRRIFEARLLARQLPSELGNQHVKKGRRSPTFNEILHNLQKGQALLENLCRCPENEMTWDNFDYLAKRFFIPEEAKGDLAQLLEQKIGTREQAEQRKSRAVVKPRKVFSSRPKIKEPQEPVSTRSSSTAIPPSAPPPPETSSSSVKPRKVSSSRPKIKEPQEPVSTRSSSTAIPPPAPPLPETSSSSSKAPANSSFTTLNSSSSSEEVWLVSAVALLALASLASIICIRALNLR